MDTFLYVASLAGAGVLCVLATVFVVAYHRRSGGAWRESAEGRHMMRATGLVAVLAGLAFAGHAWGTLVSRSAAYAAQALVLWLVVVEIGIRLSLMLRDDE